MKTQFKEMGFEFHHMGVPTSTPQPNERYSPTVKMYTTPGDNPFRIQYHRFEEGCSLHPLIQTVPHVAFKVPDIEKALEALSEYEIILDLYEPLANFKVAMISIDGQPMELLETTLSEEEIWDESKHKNSKIYPD